MTTNPIARSRTGKPMLDHRVAHAHARTTILSAQDGGMVAGGFDTLIYDRLMHNDLGALPRTAKGARRKVAEAMRYIARNALFSRAQESKKAGPYAEWLGLEGYTKDFTIFCKKPYSEDGIALAQFRFFPSAEAFVQNRTLLVRTLGKFSLHAIARHYQRDGHADWKRVASELLEALPAVWLNLRATASAQLLQACVPVRSGMFVGSAALVAERVALLDLRTYLPQQNCQARWAKVSEAVRTSATILSPQRAAELLLEAPEEEAEATAVRTFSGAISGPACAWLRDSYSPAIDVDADAWRAHRQASLSRTTVD